MCMKGVYARMDSAVLTTRATRTSKLWLVHKFFSAAALGTAAEAALPRNVAVLLSDAILRFINLLVGMPPAHLP